MADWLPIDPCANPKILKSDPGIDWRVEVGFILFLGMMVSLLGGLIWVWLWLYMPLATIVVCVVTGTILAHRDISDQVVFPRPGESAHIFQNMRDIWWYQFDSKTRASLAPVYSTFIELAQDDAGPQNIAGGVRKMWERWKELSLVAAKQKQLQEKLTARTVDDADLELVRREHKALDEAIDVVRKLEN